MDISTKRKAHPNLLPRATLSQIPSVIDVTELMRRILQAHSCITVTLHPLLLVRSLCITSNKLWNHRRFILSNQVKRTAVCNCTKSRVSAISIHLPPGWGIWYESAWQIFLTRSFSSLRFGLHSYIHPSSPKPIALVWKANWCKKNRKKQTLLAVGSIYLKKKNAQI